jgi:hypothetical protein
MKRLILFCLGTPLDSEALRLLVNVGVNNGFTSIWNFDIKLITVAAGDSDKRNYTQILITWMNHEKHLIREFSSGKTQSSPWKGR